MAGALEKLFRRLRYGESIVVVSGLPRSGTSMLMRMLEAGGMNAVTDGERAADEDNPRGYFEDRRVKDLAVERDRRWLRSARGRALKVISHLLKELPPDNHYKVLLSVRDLDEVVASQKIMLERLGEPDPLGDAQTRALYEKHLLNVRVLMRRRPNFEVLEVRYREAVDDPPGCAARINAFLGGRLDTARMAQAVDGSLYRNRAGPGAG